MIFTHTLNIEFANLPSYEFYIYKLSELERKCTDEDDEPFYFVSFIELDLEKNYNKTPLENMNRLYDTIVKPDLGAFGTSLDLCRAWASERAALFVLYDHNIIEDTDPDQLRIDFNKI